MAEKCNKNNNKELKKNLRKSFSSYFESESSFSLSRASSIKKQRDSISEQQENKQEQEQQHESSIPSTSQNRLIETSTTSNLKRKSVNFNVDNLILFNEFKSNENNSMNLATTIATNPEVLKNTTATNGKKYHSIERIDKHLGGKNNKNSPEKRKFDENKEKQLYENVENTESKMNIKKETSASEISEVFIKKDDKNRNNDDDEDDDDDDGGGDEENPIKKIKIDIEREEMFEIFQPWALKTYGDQAKTKTITLKKRARILRALEGKEHSKPDSSKFRFWVKSKGFTTKKPENFIDTKDKSSNKGINDVDLFVASTSKDFGERYYRKVAVVEEFFDIIFDVHVRLGGRSGRHAGQKRTYRIITETYAFLPREAVTKFLSGCPECKKNLRPLTPTRSDDPLTESSSEHEIIHCTKQSEKEQLEKRKFHLDEESLGNVTHKFPRLSTKNIPVRDILLVKPFQLSQEDLAPEKSQSSCKPIRTSTKSQMRSLRHTHVFPQTCRSNEYYQQMSDEIKNMEILNKRIQKQQKDTIRKPYDIFMNERQRINISDSSTTQTAFDMASLRFDTSQGAKQQFSESDNFQMFLHGLDQHPIRAPMQTSFDQFSSQNPLYNLEALKSNETFLNYYNFIRKFCNPQTSWSPSTAPTPSGFFNPITRPELNPFLIPLQLAKDSYKKLSSPQIQKPKFATLSPSTSTVQSPKVASPAATTSSLDLKIFNTEPSPQYPQKININIENTSSSSDSSIDLSISPPQSKDSKLDVSINVSNESNDIKISCKSTPPNKDTYKPDVTGISPITPIASDIGLTSSPTATTSSFNISATPLNSERQTVQTCAINLSKKFLNESENQCDQLDYKDTKNGKTNKDHENDDDNNEQNKINIISNEQQPSTLESSDLLRMNPITSTYLALTRSMGMSDEDALKIDDLVSKDFKYSL